MGLAHGGRPPHEPIFDAPILNPQINVVFEECGHHPQWPQGADTVIEACRAMVRGRMCLFLRDT